MKRLIVSNPEQTGKLNPDFLYQDRMEMRLKDIQRRKGTPGEYTKQQEQKMYIHEKNMKGWNMTDLKRVEKLNKNLAIIVGTHSGHAPWLRACLEACQKTGYFVLLAYDNPFWKAKDMARILPAPSTLALADAIVFKHRSYLHSVGVAHFWNNIYGLSLIKALGFKYIYALNGDCVMEKPENLDQLINMLGNGDIFPNQYEPERRYIGTMGYVSKTDIMLELFHIHRRELHMYSRTTEGRLWYYVKENNLKVVPPKENHVHNYRLCGTGTWYETVGFRHIHAEHKVTRRDKLPPPEQKFYDLPDPYYSGGEWALLKQYWKTKSQEDLNKWWGVK